MKEVLPGVWWLHGTRGCNAYVVRGDDGAFALIDPGFALNIAVLLRELEQLPGRAHLSYILLTHRHFDHSGAAAALARATGAKIVAGHGDTFLGHDQTRYLRDDRLRSPAILRRVVRWIMRIREHDEPIPVHTIVDARCEVIPGIVAFPVPGHTDGTCVYLLPRADACFVGDLCISYGDGLHRSMALANDDDALYLDTLRDFAAVAAGNGFPGHGAPVLGGFRDELLDAANRPRRTKQSLGAMRRRSRRMWEFGGLIFRARRDDTVSALSRTPVETLEAQAASE